LTVDLRSPVKLGTANKTFRDENLDLIKKVTAAPGGSAIVSAATATDSAADASLVLPADAVEVFPLAGATSDEVAPLDNNGAAPTAQFINRLYLPLVNR